MNATALDEQDFAEIRRLLESAAALHSVTAAKYQEDGHGRLANDALNEATRCKALAEKIATEVGV